MEIIIRECQENDLESLQNLTVAAFEPIFASFASILGTELYKLVYPDWQTLQRNLVLSLYNNEKVSMWMAEADRQAAGLIAYQFQDEDKTGVIEFLVVNPAFQNAGIGTRLNEFALAKMQEAGMQVALVGTGGDESHAPARKAYEKAGFTALPSVWYFKRLV